MSLGSLKGTPTTTIIRLGDQRAPCPTPSGRHVGLPPVKPRRTPSSNCSSSKKQLYNKCEVLFDFCYETQVGQKVRMKKGEKFILLKKMNDDWFKVKRIDHYHDDDDDDLLLDNEELKRKGSKRSQNCSSSKCHTKSNSTGSIDVSSCEELDINFDEEEIEQVVSCPFYAPASYLKELREQFELDSSLVNTCCSSPSSSTVLLSGSFSCDDSCEDIDSGNLEEDEIEDSSNVGATSSRESLTDIDASRTPRLTSDTTGFRTKLSGIKLSKMNISNSKTSQDCDIIRVDCARSPSPDADYENVPLPVLPIKTRIHQKSSTPPPFCPEKALTPKNLPPSPKYGHSPVRILLDHWAEYMDTSGRRFYFNSVTRDSSWKPPRRRPSFIGSSEQLNEDEDNNLTFSEEDLVASCASLDPLSLEVAADASHVTPSLGSHLVDQLSSSLPCRPKPKTKPRKLLSAHIYRPPTLTKGWSRHLDPETREIFFVNENTKDKWLCKLDENGRLYFFEENGQESYWELPDLNSVSSEAMLTKSTCDLNDQSLNIVKRSSSKSASGKKSNSIIDKETGQSVSGKGASSSLVDSVESSPNTKLSATVTRRPLERNSSFGRTKATVRSIPSPILPVISRLTPADRLLKTRSMAILPTSDRQNGADKMTQSFGPTIGAALPANLPAILLQHAGALGLFPSGVTDGQRSNIAFYQASEPPSSLEDAKATKLGVLTRTRLTDGGKKLRKNWINSLIALTDDYLLLFKEAKPMANNANKPEIVIDLAGSQVDWSPDKSSRKNVFRIRTVSGHEILFQDDCPLICKEWFDGIRASISRLPSRTVHRQQSTGSGEHLDIVKVPEKEKSKLKRSKSQKYVRSVSDPDKDNKELVFLVPEVEPLPPERRKKITERLRQFLRKRPTLESLREKGIFKDEPVFGCVLSNLCARDKSSIPKFVRQSVDAIEKKDMKADGIYRVCGNLSQVQRIRFQVNQDNYTGLWSEEDVHVLTGLLKMFFRDMKEPLFPCAMFDSLMKAISLPDRKSKVDALTKLVAELAPTNKETLKFLLEHLLRIKEHSDENRMHIQNLAIVFGPTLMWPEMETNNFAYDMMLRMHQNQIIELLLVDYHGIFKV